MKTSKTSTFTMILGLGLFFAGLPSADAAALIYKVSISAKATYFAANSFSDVGYLIIDLANVGTAQTVQVFSKTKTYQINGGMAQVIAPTALGFFTLNRSTSDPFFETQGASAAFQNGNIVQAMSYIGVIPKNGFRLGNTLFTGTARSLKGKGSVNVVGTDFFTRADTFTVDPLSGASPVDTNAGVVLVTGKLAGKGFVQVP
ncbi:MAG: hypothetical protein WCF18_11635 [Chthoniobacteraceae bacterium]